MQERPNLKKSIEYELKSLPALQKFVAQLKDKIATAIVVKKADEGNSLQISTENRDLRIQIFPILTEKLTESYKIEALTAKKEYETVLHEILGGPKKTTRVMPTILDLANAIKKASKETWEAEVSNELALSENELERLVNALKDAATMKGAPSQIKEAADIIA
jgi:hypothetical protein